ncbi:hypothetical protein [Marispirochaeta sp.]|uniref:hypothetical protein n=1 Tax=Marispirochaeta sp. TaxID=2038653 RepID=UPI003747F59B
MAVGREDTDQQHRESSHYRHGIVDNGAACIGKGLLVFTSVGMKNARDSGIAGNLEKTLQRAYMGS